MSGPFLSAEQRKRVVFWVNQDMGYVKRLIIGFGAILTGLAIQLIKPSVWWLGAPFLFIGNLFLVTQGYDNRVKFGKYSAGDAWEKVSDEKLAELEALIKKLKKWDRSLVDVSNPLGKFVFIVMGISVFLLWNGFDEIFLSYRGAHPLGRIMAADIVLLLLPHWITGKRKIPEFKKFSFKLKHLRKLLNGDAVKFMIHECTVDYFLLLKGADNVPGDVKFRVGFPSQHEDFLGFYGQIVINEVNSKMYPYFYVVLVARKGYGLGRDAKAYAPPAELLKDFKTQGDVEVLVIRRRTTRTSGYHTKKRMMRRIFTDGLTIAEKAAVREG